MDANMLAGRWEWH